MATYNTVEGWTDPIDCILKADGVALSLTGFTVALVAYDKDDALLTLAGTVSVPSPAIGQVRFSPALADLKAEDSPLRVRWKVTDGASKIRYIPNVQPDSWVVRKP